MQKTDTNNPRSPRGINPTKSDIGRRVVYRSAPYYEAEEGVLTSYSGTEPGHVSG